MFTVTKYPQGTFSWVDANTSDADAGTKFYADLMGWTYELQPMGGGQDYTMFSKDGHTVAGLSQLQPDMAGMPPVWNNYITVDDVDAMAEKVTELGGQVLMGPMDVFENGRMIFFVDPTGAAAALWQPYNHIGSGLVNVPGSVTWNELYTTDLQKAQDFYGQLLGWTFEQGPIPNYLMIHNNGRLNGGIMLLDESFGDMPPNWTVYFSVEDIDAAAKKVEEFGGKLMTPVSEAPGTGRFAIISDPQGAMSALIQLNEPQPWTD